MKIKLLGKNNNLSIIFFILIFILIIATRFYNIESIPPPIHVDESFMGQSAIAILQGSKNLFDTYFSTTIIDNLLTALLIKVFGVSVLVLRTQSIFFGIGTSIFLYLLVKDMFGKRLALLSFFFGSFSHLAIAYSRINIPCIQAPFFLVLVLYLLNMAIKKKNSVLFFAGGLATSLSLYSYTGAKIIILLGFIFLCTRYKDLRIKYWLLFFIGLLMAALPLLIYIAGANNYLQREAEVTIFSKPEIFFARWNTTNIFTVIYLQLRTNFLGFISIEDYSNQYGNGILLDKLSRIIFLLFFILFPISLIRRRLIRDLKIKFFLISLAIILFLVSFTESPPLSTRLLVLYPIISILIAWTVERLYLFMKKVNYGLAIFFITFTLTTVLLLNLKIYFIDYIANGNPYYSWIEPNSSIGLYSKSNWGKKIYLLSNPHTYSNQSIISVLNFPKKPMEDLVSFEQINELIKTKSSYTIIVPLAPVAATNAAFISQEYIVEKILDNNFTKKYYYGTPCKDCTKRPIFLIITKNDL